MTTLTAPAPQANTAATNGEKPINLFQLGCLFVIRASYWSCRIGNEPQDFHLAPHEVESKAIASFGSKELIDPHKGRKVFQQIEKKARHQLAKYSKPFPAANAHFVPWEHAPELIDKLEGLKAEFDQAVEDFLLQYPQLRAEWQCEHPDVPDAAYPAAADLRKKFSFGWHTFKVAGAASAMAVDDIQAELASQQLRDEQLAQMKQNLQAECQEFAADYVMAFRQEVAEFCDQVIDAGGNVMALGCPESTGDCVIDLGDFAGTGRIGQIPDFASRPVVRGHAQATRQRLFRRRHSNIRINSSREIQGTS